MLGELIFSELFKDINVFVGVKLVKIYYYEYKRFIYYMLLKFMY